MFEFENNLRNNPAALLELLWRNNPEALCARLFTYGFEDVNSFSEFVTALYLIHQDLGVEGVLDAITVNLYWDELSPVEVAALENVAAMDMRQKSFSFAGDPPIDLNYLPDAPSSPATPDGDGDRGGGNGWQIVGNVANVVGTLFGSFFGGAANVGNNSGQPGSQTPNTATPEKSSNLPLIIGGAVLFLVLILVLFLIAKSKK